MRRLRRLALSASLAALLAACCPTPLSRPQGSETAFVATVLFAEGEALTVQLKTGERLRVLPAAGLEPGARVYVRGVLQGGYVAARSVHPVARP